MAALTTIALVAGAVTGVYSAYQAHESRKDQEKAFKKSEAEAKKVQDEQAALAKKEESTAAEKLKEQQTRLLKGRTSGGGLLFGSELGTAEQTQTLGG